MTKKEYNLVKTFVQALVDESSARGMYSSNGISHLLVRVEDVEKLLGRILEFLVDEKQDHKEED